MAEKDKNIAMPIGGLGRRIEQKMKASKVMTAEQKASEEEIKGENIKSSEEVLNTILDLYRKPSFGSMSKRDVDIMLFMAMQDRGLIGLNPQTYEVMQYLRVTRAKARNLIYEVALRRMESEAVLKQELHDILSKAVILKETDKVAIEIDNPLLIDYLRKELKELKHLTDGSFSPELVKMEYDAFAHIYEVTRTEEEKKAVKQRLVELGIKQEYTLRSTITALLQYGGKKIAGKFGGEVAKDIVDIICEHWENISGVIREKANELFENPNS